MPDTGASGPIILSFDSATTAAAGPNLFNLFLSAVGGAPDRPTTNYTDPAVGKKAQDEANALLGPAMSQGYSSMDDAVKAWANVGRAVGAKYDTEVGAGIFMANGKYWLGSSVSDGRICSKSYQCGVNAALSRTKVAGAVEVGYVHNHPDNSMFSNEDMMGAYFVEQYDKRPQTAYVVLANSEIWAWSTETLYQHPQGKQRDWQPYVKYSRRVK